MTIQIPNPGTGVPSDQTGDSPWLAMTKVAENFSNQTHAASKLVGTATGEIPLAENTYKAIYTKTPVYLNTVSARNPNTFLAGERYFGSYSTNPPPAGQIIETHATYLSANLIQYATPYSEAGSSFRTFISGVWSAWVPTTTNKMTYNTTTASGANVVVDATGQLMRSTSSERYKDIISDLTLDDVAYANAMQLAPIVYRSTAEADDPTYHFYSFSAEKLGAFDPAFTLWRTTETVTDADGNTTEQPLAEKQAEGLNINALLAFNHAIAIKQDKMIAAQAEAIATLTQRIDAMTAP